MDCNVICYNILVFSLLLSCDQPKPNPRDPGKWFGIDQITSSPWLLFYDGRDDINLVSYSLHSTGHQVSSTLLKMTLQA